MLLAAPAAAMEAGAELEATLEALRTLEREQEQRLSEIERLEDRITEVAQRNLQLRGELRETRETIAVRDREVADLEAAAQARSQDLDATARQAASLLRGQWLRQRHQGGVPGATGLRHQREFDMRIQTQREQALARFAAQLAALTQAMTELAAARAALVEREGEVGSLLREIERQEQEQAALLARVQRQAQDDALEAERLERNAETLERMLRGMEQQRLSEPGPPGAHTGAGPGDAAPGSPFATQKGVLPRPVDGPFLHRYGSARSGGPQTQWRGEVFAAGDDTEVRAVHGGYTVYADWMRGFGFLVIVSHGDNYLTLYGNNRELLTQPGQPVTGGQIIARAGATSAVIAPGLYFELRHRGEILNPGSWWDSK